MLYMRGIDIDMNLIITTNKVFLDSGYKISGTSPDGRLVELIELVDHPYFLACQYHPEFLSRPGKPHPLFKGLIKASQEKLEQSN